MIYDKSRGKYHEEGQQELKTVDGCCKGMRSNELRREPEDCVTWRKRVSRVVPDF